MCMCLSSKHINSEVNGFVHQSYIGRVLISSKLGFGEVVIIDLIRKIIFRIPLVNQRQMVRVSALQSAVIFGNMCESKISQFV